MIFYRFLDNDTAFRSSSELDSFSDLVHHICMSYISDLRKKLGHQTIIQCAASIIIVNPEGELLLGKEPITVTGAIRADRSRSMKKWKIVPAAN